MSTPSVSESSPTGVPHRTPHRQSHGGCIQDRVLGDVPVPHPLPWTSFSDVKKRRLYYLYYVRTRKALEK